MEGESRARVAVVNVLSNHPVRVEPDHGIASAPSSGEALHLARDVHPARLRVERVGHRCTSLTSLTDWTTMLSMGKSSLLSEVTARCPPELVTDEAGPHDVAVKVYLVRPRENDVR
jgi:hypothetical protein